MGFGVHYSGPNYEWLAADGYDSSGEPKVMVVQLSPEDRELLRRIADRLDANGDTSADTSFADTTRRLTEADNG